MLSAPSLLLGVDTGGTFTDFVLFSRAQQEIRIHKVLSTPQAPEVAILQGIAEMGLATAIANGEAVVIHGSTVATNAALEGKGVKTAFITNRGLKDMLTIGRQTRAQLYNLQPSAQVVPVPPELCLEADCRLSADGRVVEKLSDTCLADLQKQLRQLQPEAVAINLLYSFLDDNDEKAIESIVPEGVFTSRSSFVLPEYKEYERGIATWLNAYLGPRVQHYIARLQTAIQPCPLGVMQSSGGTIDAEQAGRRAVNLLLSGPAGGLAAARFIGRTCHAKKLITFDMGGTSTDVALIDGELQLTSEGRLGPYPVAVPMVDMHTIGAGGGSLAYLDSGGLLQVGPQSAGADPGPACYGRGGSEPSVTDANLVLGRLRPDHFLGGNLRLDGEAATAAVTRLARPLRLSLEETAQGIVDIANEHMIRALRVISVQRGHDPRDFQLCCFGGAGGLHVCALAQALGMTQALVPVYGGVLSALGMLVAPRERQLSRTWQGRLQEVSESELREHLLELGNEGRRQLLREGVSSADISLQPSLDLRYQGQSYTLNISFSDIEQAESAFHLAHENRYGHSLRIPVELVNIRQRVSAAAEPIQLPTLFACPTYAHDKPEPSGLAELHGFGHTPIYQREKLEAGHKISGPALICEQISTTLVAANWEAEVDPLGNLLLRVAPRGQGK